MAWKVKTLARVVNGWSMNTDTMGVYGNYYLKRAMVTQIGLGREFASRRGYPLNLFDKSGQALDGANKYAIHFDKTELPPVNAFWSITLYDPAGNAYPNSLDRQAVSSWMPFVYMPTDRSIFISRTKIRAPRMKPTGCPRPRAVSI